ncbi:MAG: hypothetical protein HZB51_12405 [Chloroflexi bacterium]|nr:hypothetical protein [Chloroflexota bacterium]
MITRIDSLDKLFSRKELHLAERERFEETAGSHYGLVFGIATVLAGWGWDTYELWRAGSEFFWLKLVLIAATLIPLTTLAGTLVGRIHGANLRRVIVWVVAGGIIGPLSLLVSTEGLSAVIAIFDPAVRGISLYPFSSGVQERIPLVATFGALTGMVVTALQALTARWTWESSSSDNRLTRRGWVLLWLCAPFAIGLGALYDGSLNSQLRAPVQLSYRLIQLMLAMPPDADIQKMNTSTVLDYVGASRWQKHFTPRYVQRISDYDRKTLRTAFVDAEFDNGFVWRCQTIINGYGTKDCVDLVEQYRDWMQQFLKTGIVQCENCMVTIPPPTQIWQTQNATNLSEPREISLVHHAGGVVVVTATLPSSQAECRFVGASPTSIRDCVKR